jgi:transcriptional regulator with XRE-family HTH domain
MAVPQNIIGPTVRKIRYQKGWTQAMLTARCARVGWDISENTIAKIEAQIRCVTDREVTALAKALEVPIANLFRGA